MGNLGALYGGRNCHHILIKAVSNNNDEKMFTINIFMIQVTVPDA